MKTPFTAIATLALATSISFAQPGPGPGGGGRFGGPPGMFDSSRRTEMMVQRLAEDIGLNKDQRTKLKDVIDHAQTAAKPLQQELQDTRKQIRDAVKTGKKQDELDSLHQKLGATYAKLAAVQSTAFADGLKLLNEEQREDADSLYDSLSMITGGGGGRGGMMRGGFGGFGPPGSGRGGPRSGADRPPGDQPKPDSAK